METSANVDTDVDANTILEYGLHRGTFCIQGHNLNILPVDVIRYINTYITQELDNKTIRQAVHYWFGYQTNRRELEYYEKARAGIIFKYGPIENWNTSKVAVMSSMFEDAFVFNQDISRWDVSNVLDMNCMFRNACVFDKDISCWNVSNVQNMGCMFNGATQFSQDISTWDVSVEMG